MLYLLENSDRLTADFLRQGMPLISRQRQEKLHTYGAQRDKLDGCAAYLLLRYALLTEYGLTAAPQFSFGEHDKPFLQDTPALHFNFSHCKTAVACILSDKNTAVDVTDRRFVKPNVYRRVCSPEEQQRIAESTDPHTCFLRMWTRKECLAKLTGEGMSHPFRTITDEWPQAAFVHTEERDWGILSYYAEEPLPAVSLTAEKLLTVLREKVPSGI